MNWDEYIMRIAMFVAKKSKDPSTQVGAVIVGGDNEILSTGFNGMPMLVDDEVPERLERPEKYFWFEHAERNAIYLAGRRGVELYGSRMYTTIYPCSGCARGIIQVGIKGLVVLSGWETRLHGDWEKDKQVARRMFTEACIQTREIEING